MTKTAYYTLLVILLALIPFCVYLLYWSMICEFFEFIFPTEKYASNQIGQQELLIKDSMFINLLEQKHTIIQTTSLVIGTSSLLSVIYLIIKRKSILK
jgi:hypothetical protein